MGFFLTSQFPFTFSLCTPNAKKHSPALSRPLTLRVVRALCKRQQFNQLLHDSMTRISRLPSNRTRALALPWLSQSYVLGALHISYASSLSKVLLSVGIGKPTLAQAAEICSSSPESVSRRAWLWVTLSVVASHTPNTGFTFTPTRWERRARPVSSPCRSTRPCVAPSVAL